jgi:CHASE3 domain sensor protein
MDGPSAVAAIFVFASLATMVIGVAHYWYKARTAKSNTPGDVEMRLARLEVAIDDMTAAISQMTDSHQFLTAALTQRGLPVEASRESK